MHCARCRWYATEAPNAPTGSCMHAPPVAVCAGMNRQHGIGGAELAPIVLSLRPTVGPDHYCSRFEAFVHG